jgi:prepilin-type processing-associated H-X9-DG protein
MNRNPDFGYIFKTVLAVIVSLGLIAAAAGVGWYFLVTVPKQLAVERAAQRNGCESNLKMLGLDFRVWAIEHNGKFPFNVPTSEGGTLELCQRGTDGVDAHALGHYLCISNVYWPRCNQLSQGDWTTNQITDALYHLHTARQGELSSGILAYCPKHHNVLYVDGSVSWDYKSEAVLEAEAAAADAKVIDAEAKKAQETAREQAQERAQEQAREVQLRRSEEERERTRARIEAMYPDLERDWTFKAGATRKGKFVRLDGNAVVVDFSEGQSGVFTVPLGNLSSFDQAVARAMAAARPRQ